MVLSWGITTRLLGWCWAAVAVGVVALLGGSAHLTVAGKNLYPGVKPDRLLQHQQVGQSQRRIFDVESGCEH